MKGEGTSLPHPLDKTNTEYTLFQSTSIQTVKYLYTFYNSCNYKHTDTFIQIPKIYVQFVYDSVFVMVKIGNFLNSQS